MCPEVDLFITRSKRSTRLKISTEIQMCKVVTPVLTNERSRLTAPLLIYFKFNRSLIKANQRLI
jgi:hypothetical protein